MNEEKFLEDLESEEVVERVKQSVSEGQARGVTSTPTFFINGEKVEESRNYNQVLELLKAKL
jgi:protein-disulfide isomerase